MELLTGCQWDLRPKKKHLRSGRVEEEEEVKQRLLMYKCHLSHRQSSTTYIGTRFLRIFISSSVDNISTHINHQPNVLLLFYVMFQTHIDF